MKPLRNIRALCMSAIALTWAAGVYAADAPKSGGQACWSNEVEKNLASCPGSGPTTFNVGTHGK